MHAAHPFVGVSRIASSEWNPCSSIPTFSIEIFSQTAERDLARRLIEGIMSFDPRRDWHFRTIAEGCRNECDVFAAADCAIVLCGSEPFSPASIARFEEHVRSGGATIVLNAGAQRSPEWKTFACETLGSCWEDDSFTTEKRNFRIASGRHFHPIVQDVFAWEIECLPATILDLHAEVLLEGVFGKKRQPLAWLPNLPKSNIFCTLLGSRQDFRQPSFLRLMRNALHWMQEAK
jgi:hypothetical protein